MSGRIRIHGLVFATALVVLCAGQSFGQGRADPCGGHYAGEGLKATFLESYGDLILPGEPGYIPPGELGYPAITTWLSNITNGNANSYPYLVPGGDCVYLYRNGHVIVGVGWPLEWPDINHERYVNMRFEQKDGGVCNPVATLASFMDGSVVHTRAIQFWTGGGFTPTRGADNKLLLTGTAVNLNWGAMIPGETYYCGIMVRFVIEGDVNEEEYRFDTEVKIYYGPLNNGSFGWEISPIHEPYDIQPVTKVRKQVVPSGEPIPHESSVYHQELHSQTSNGCWGRFYFPFKLVLERL
jgi:hypothetical protein